MCICKYCKRYRHSIMQFAEVQLNSNIFPPINCTVLPTFNSGFIARVQKFPPLNSSFLHDATDFKLYWLRNYGYVSRFIYYLRLTPSYRLSLPDTFWFAQVRIGDKELTYPSCCVWEDKPVVVRSQNIDAQNLIRDVLDDLKSIVRRYKYCAIFTLLIKSIIGIRINSSPTTKWLRQLLSCGST